MRAVRSSRAVATRRSAAASARAPAAARPLTDLHRLADLVGRKGLQAELGEERVQARVPGADPGGAQLGRRALLEAVCLDPPADAVTRFEDDDGMPCSSDRPGGEESRQSRADD